MNCICQASQAAGTGALDAFALVRSGCPALREILVPEQLWPEFEEWHRRPLDSSHHQSMLLLAMRRGYLAQTISPVHRFLLRDGAIRSEVTKHYLADLQERWMMALDPVRRHQRFRSFSGKLAELQVADWLDHMGWTIDGLEALGAASDIEATPPADATKITCEVKLIGVEDADFSMIVDGFNGVSTTRTYSPYAAANYLIFKAYEAAHQLLHVGSRRVAIVVVEGLSWHKFEAQLQGRWIDWAEPKFVDSHDWDAFMEKQQSRYPHLAADLVETLHGVDALWILKREHGCVLSRELVQGLRSA